MNSNLAASVLKKEKELLEEMLNLAECQQDLLGSDRVEDLEILLELRARSLAKLDAVEAAVDAEMDTQTATTEELDDLHKLNLAIINLVDRIIALDEKADWLAEHCGDYASTELSAETGLHFSD
jgi:hypothetical protein